MRNMIDNNKKRRLLSFIQLRKT